MNSEAEIGASTDKTLVILGGASAVAVAYARLKAAAGGWRICLVGRNEDALCAIRDDLIARGAAQGSSVTAGEIGEPERVGALLPSLLERAGPIDEALLAYGALGDQPELQTDLAQLRALLETNAVSAAMWMEGLAGAFERNGSGRLIVLGSVAGDRGRQSNYIYGASKALLERLCEGMAHRFAKSREIGVTLVKPGFIDTPMTDHLDKSGPLWATPEQIASAIDRAVRDKRSRVYAPWFWRWILLIIRALPVPLMHRTKL